MKPLMLKLKQSGKVNLDVIVSSSMVLDKYASAYKDIESDGFEIKGKFNCLVEGDSHESMVQTAAMSMIHHSNFFKENKPDLLLVVGDRFDMFPIVLSASYMNIDIAHIQGGEISSSIDDTIRNMISLSSSLHFTATELSKKRVTLLGCTNVWNYGCPAVEYITSLNIGDKFDFKYLHKTFKHKIDIEDDEKYIITLLHPDTKNPSDVDMDIVLKVLKKTGVKCFVFYPNPDACNSRITQSINKYKTYENFYFIKHIPIEGYIHLLAHASCMVSNSSSGIREAASFGTPVINVGNRQLGREKNESTFNCSCNFDDMLTLIDFCMNKGFDKDNKYYKENCTENIYNKILEYLGE